MAAKQAVALSPRPKLARAEPKSESRSPPRRSDAQVLVMSSGSAATSREGLARRFAEMKRLEAHDIAVAIAYIVTRPRHVAINEILIRPTEQEQ